MSGSGAARWGLITCVVLLAGCGGSGAGEADAIAVGAGDVTVQASGSGAAQEDDGIVVDVSGAVRRPGVYRLAEGSRVHEAIAAAGGATSRADTTALNRAADAVDGAQIVVPIRDAVPGRRGTAGAGPDAKTSINTADPAALDALPGIGPATAQKIVDDRAANGPFTSIEDLDRVPGIGPSTVQQLASAVTL